MLCMHCHRPTGVAYNELCFQCYKRIGRIPLSKTAKRAQLELGKGLQGSVDASRVIAA